MTGGFRSDTLAQIQQLDQLSVAEGLTVEKVMRELGVGRKRATP
jgi:hypothetical protein